MGLLKHLLPLVFLSYTGICTAASIDSPLPPAQRIAALSPHAVEMLYAIGAGDKIIATTEHADYPSQAQHIPRIGGYYGIQLEKLLALHPDLVVVWSGGNRQEDIDKIRQLGLKVFDSNPEKLGDIATEMETLGALTGEQEQAHQAAEKYRTELANLKHHSENLPKVKVFYQLWAEPLMTVSDNTWIQQIIGVCGGENVFSSAEAAYPKVSIENVLNAAPQVILQSQEQANIQGINWRNWPQLPAVQHSQIYQLNPDLLHRAGPRTIEGIKAACLAINRAR